MNSHVLLVDDDVSVVAALSGVLLDEGYGVVQASNGHEAMERFHAFPKIDIVLLDLCMPVKGGWDIFERLTAINPLLPIIVITARSDQHAMADGAGVAALLEKPLDIPVLLETMQRLLAESPDTRLARMAGKNPHTLHREASTGTALAAGSSR